MVPEENGGRPPEGGAAESRISAQGRPRVLLGAKPRRDAAARPRLEEYGSMRRSQLTHSEYMTVSNKI